MRQSRYDAITPWAVAAVCLAGAGLIALSRSAARQQNLVERDRESAGIEPGTVPMVEPSNAQRLVVASAGVGAGMLIATYALRGPRYTGLKLKCSILINRAPSELYAFWKRLDNLAALSDMLSSVELLDDVRSRWTIRAPGNIPVHWDAEITKDLPDEMIGWRSAAGAPIETAGYVRFEPAPGNRGTIVRVALEYNPVASRVGAAIATMFGKEPSSHIETFLRKLKQVTEAGETATSGYQPARIAS